METLPSPDRTVAGKLMSIKKLGAPYDLVVVHRDADGAGRGPRFNEISDAIDQVMPGTSWAGAIPVRMTEAWLVLDETLIRSAAGNPNGKMPLDIPTWKQAERLADPKTLLRDLLVEASGLTGRRRKNFISRLSHHRSQMLELLDPSGPVR
ncbi:hypothetical protein [Dactylosporangium sp. NPDC005555]|uniref:hypothetical protein n=1 Tax=Dactylosporangium sp. NPDC005555 TaxID=3154889 RepID=UPI0033AA5828